MITTKEAQRVALITSKMLSKFTETGVNMDESWRDQLAQQLMDKRVEIMNKDLYQLEIAFDEAMAHEDQVVHKCEFQLTADNIEWIIS